MAPARPSVPRPVLTAIAACLLALHAWLALMATIDLGFTGDETAHLTGGVSYWKFDDYRLQPENGNLPQRWAALPVVALKPHLNPSETPDLWRRSHVWLIAQHFLFESGNNTEFLLFVARAAMVVWSLATGLLVFFWSRRLWGDVGAILSLLLYCLSPTVLAHAPLVTSDMCAAFWLLAATGAWWRAAQHVSPARVALSLAATALLAVAKFSCVLFAPIAAVMMAWLVLRPEPLRIGAGRAVSSRRGKLFVQLALGAAHVVIAWVFVWACFGFRYSAFAPDLPAATKFFVDWSGVMPRTGVSHWLFQVAINHHLLPEAYLQGFAYVLEAAQQRGAFLAGNFSAHGWWWFFPYAFLVKSSLTELCIAGAVLWLGIRQVTRRRDSAVRSTLEPIVPLLALGFIYTTFSVTSHLNIGQRHILPLYPVLFILSGALARAKFRWRAALPVAAGAAAIFELSMVRPHYLAFFNAAAGGPALGWRQLVDSSLDWGQNVPRLASWLKQHRKPGEAVYVSLFGSDDPFYHGINAEELSPYFSFGRHRQWTELKPGLYCIGATMLQDVYSPYAGPWTATREMAYRSLLPALRTELVAGTRTRDLGEFGRGPEQPLWNLDRARFARLCLYLRARGPDATIGHSIFVYRLTQAEIDVVVEGSFVDLAAAAQKAAAAGDHGS